MLMGQGTEFQFMVDFTLPNSLCADFLQKLPAQKELVNQFFSQGKLLSYALSLENQKLWAVFSGQSELEVLELVTRLPLTKFMDVHISELVMFDTLRTTQTPIFSPN